MRYVISSHAMQTTTGPVVIATGTGLKTLLQVKPGATVPLKIIEWGISLQGFAAAAPGTVELIETDVAATVTASVANDITKHDAIALLAGDPTTAMIAVGTTSTGYNASAEGTTTASRNLDGPQLVSPTNQFIKQYPLGAEPVIQLAKFARIRVQFSASVNAICYMVVEV